MKYDPSSSVSEGIRPDTNELKKVSSPCKEDKRVFLEVENLCPPTLRFITLLGILKSEMHTGVNLFRNFHDKITIYNPTTLTLSSFDFSNFRVIRHFDG